MTNLPDRSDRPASPDPRHLRASDVDREKVAQALRDAAGDGRINLEELEERLTVAYTARTYAELEPLTHDLPLGPSAGPTVSAPDHRIIVGGTPSARSGIAIMSETKRRGRWRTPGRFAAFAYWGKVLIDLREAQFTEPEMHIRAFAVMGNVEVIAPPDLDVTVKGLGIMGAFDDDATGPGAPGAPRIIVGGFSFWGAVEVKRRGRKARKQLDGSYGSAGDED